MKLLITLLIIFIPFANYAQSKPDAAEVWEAYRELSAQVEFLSQDIHESANYYREQFLFKMMFINADLDSGRAYPNYKYFKPWYDRSQEIIAAVDKFEELSDNMTSTTFSAEAYNTFTTKEIPSMGDALLNAVDGLITQNSAIDITVLSPMKTSIKNFRSGNLSEFQTLCEVQKIYIFVARIELAALKKCWGKTPAQ